MVALKIETSLHMEELQGMAAEPEDRARDVALRLSEGISAWLVSLKTGGATAP